MLDNKRSQGPLIAFYTKEGKRGNTAALVKGGRKPEMITVGKRIKETGMKPDFSYE